MKTSLKIVSLVAISAALLALLTFSAPPFSDYSKNLSAWMEYLLM